MFRKFWSSIFGREKPKQEEAKPPFDPSLTFDFATPKERSMSWNIGRTTDSSMKFVTFMSPH